MLECTLDQLAKYDLFKFHLCYSLDESFSFRKAMDGVDAIAYFDGTVVWTSAAILLSSCQIDARRFPLDTQRCPLRFLVWGKTIEKVDLFPYQESRSTVVDLFIKNGIWKYDDLTFLREEKFYEGAG